MSKFIQSLFKESGELQDQNGNEKENQFKSQESEIEIDKEINRQQDCKHQQQLKDLKAQDELIMNEESNQNQNSQKDEKLKGKNKRKKKQEGQLQILDEKIQKNEKEPLKDETKNKKKLKVAAQLALEMQEQKRRIQQEHRKLELFQLEQEEQLQKEEQQFILLPLHVIKREFKEIKDEDKIQDKPLLKKFIQKQQQQQQLQQQIQQQKKSNEFYVCSVLGDVDSGKTTTIKGLVLFMQNQGFQVDQFGSSFICQPTQNMKSLFKEMSPYFPVNYKDQKFIFYDQPKNHQDLRIYPNCDIAILIVNIMHGLEYQSLLDLEYLKLRKIPIIIAINKFDRCFSQRNTYQQSFPQLQNQTQDCQLLFRNKLDKIKEQLNLIHLKGTLYWENYSIQTEIQLVPLSGTQGIGFEDLLATLVKQTNQKFPILQLASFQPRYLILNKLDDENDKSVLECLMIDGQIKRGENLLTSDHKNLASIRVQQLYVEKEKLKEHFFDRDWVEVNCVKDRQEYFRIITDKLPYVLQGSQFRIVNSDEAFQEAQQFIQDQYNNSLQCIKLDDEGVGIFAQDLACLLQLAQFLRQNNIQISYSCAGYISKAEIFNFTQKCQQNKFKEKYACILIFDVYVQQEFIDFAFQNQIRIIQENKLDSLLDSYQKYLKILQEEAMKWHKSQSIFPCILEISEIIQLSNVLRLKVKVLQGIITQGTSLCRFDQKNIDTKQIGRVTKLEYNNQIIQEARSSIGFIIITIELNEDKFQQSQHLMKEPFLASIISRNSINILKENYRYDLTIEDWNLVKQLKQYFQIV